MKRTTGLVSIVKFIPKKGDIEPEMTFKQVAGFLCLEIPAVVIMFGLIDGWQCPQRNTGGGAKLIKVGLKILEPEDVGDQGSISVQQDLRLRAGDMPEIMTLTGEVLKHRFQWQVPEGGQVFPG